MFDSPIAQHNLVRFQADPGVLNDAARLRIILLDTARVIGTEVLGEEWHQFEPQGCTGLLLLAESHLAIHTWPEKGEGLLDVLSCNLAVPLSPGIEFFLKAVGAGNSDIQKGMNDSDFELPHHPPFITYGILTRFADKILPLFPSQKYSTYMELFCGNGEMIWCHPPRASLEVMNDLDPLIVRLHKTIQSLKEGDFKSLQEKDWIGSEKTFGKLLKMDEPDEDLEFLYWQLYLRRFSKGGISRPRFREIDEGRPFKSVMKRLMLCSRRIKGVKITKMDYRKAIEEFDSKDTFFFMDPPYPDEHGYYPLKMPNMEEQAEAYSKIKGKVMLVIEGGNLGPFRALEGWTERRFRWPRSWYGTSGGPQSRYAMASIFTNYRPRVNKRLPMEVDVSSVAKFLVAARQEGVLALQDPRARGLCKGEVSFIVMEEKDIPSTDLLYLVDGKRLAWGQVRLKFVEPLEGEAFVNSYPYHRITEAERLARWGDDVKLYMFEAEPVSYGPRGYEPLEGEAGRVRFLTPLEELQWLASSLARRFVSWASSQTPLIDNPYPKKFLELVGPKVLNFAEVLGAREGEDLPLVETVAQIRRVLQSDIQQLPASMLLVCKSAALWTDEFLARFEGGERIHSSSQKIEKMALLDINPQSLAEVSDQELLSTHRRLHEWYAQGGENKEEVVNAELWVQGEMAARGLNHQAQDGLSEAVDQLRASKGEGELAPVLPGSDGEIQLSDVLPYFERDFAIRSPLVYLTGGLVNQGRTSGDIDLLIKGPLDEATKRAIEFRIGRSLPPELSRRISFLRDDLGGPISNYIELADLMVVFRDQYQIKEMAQGTQGDPLLDWPPSPGKRPAVVQCHFRESSMHVDLRFKIDDYLIGWTIAIQRPGTVPPVQTIEEGRRIGADMKPSGGRYFKPFGAPDGLMAFPKPRQPVEWLDIEGKVFEPGEVGAGANVPGVMVAIDHPNVEWGIQKPHFHEYFFTGGKVINGVLYFVLVPGPDGPAWKMFLSKECLPHVLKAKDSSMPPDGFSGMPSSLEEVTPEEYRFWSKQGEEARVSRDALIDSGFFSSDNISIVEGEFRRVERSISVSQKRDDVTRLCKVAISKKEERFVLGVVLEPEVEDSQGDIYSLEEVRNAAHWYMENAGNIKLMHEGRNLKKEEVKILETYLAPVDFELEGQQIRAGTWLLGIRVVDDDLWKQVLEGELTGFSIGGSAIRQPRT